MRITNHYKSKTSPLFGNREGLFYFMAATKKDVDRWVATAKKNKMKYVVSVCDTFDYDDYPVYCKNDEELEKAQKEYDGVNMQRINEIITI